MADEIKYAIQFRYVPGTMEEISRRFGELEVDVATKEHVHVIQDVGTSEEAMILGDVAAPNFCFIRNLDATNYVEVYTGTGGTAMLKLLAGEAHIFRFGSGVTAPYIKANTAACKVEYVIVDL